MRARSLTLGLTYALATTGLAAALLAPVPRWWPLAALAGLAVGLLLDLSGTRRPPRRVLNFAGAAGFFAALLPLHRETLAEQSLSALAVLMAVKLAEEKRGRDVLQVLALSLMMVAGAASLEPSLVFALFFLADLVLGVLTLLWTPFAEALPAGEAGRGLLRRLGMVAAGLAAASIPITVLVFALLPRALNPFWAGFGAHPRGVSGFSGELRLGQLGSLSRSTAVAFRAEPVQPPGPLADAPYWRGIVLDEFDGQTWRSSPAVGYPAGAGIRGAVRLTYFLEPHGERELFLLEQPLSASVGFRSLPVSPDGVVFLPSRLVSPIRYEGFSRPATDRPGKLPAAVRQKNLALPDRWSPRTRELAVSLTGGETDPAAVAASLEAFFARGFTYSLEVPSSAADPLEAFLFDHRTGYCEHFASAMALLCRAAGVPARVVAGYLGGEYNEAGGYYLVRQAAAHAWTEAWIEGRGWVRIDATPAAAEMGGTLGSRRAGRPLLWLDTLRMRWNSWVVQYDTEVQLDLAHKARRGLRAAFRGRLPGGAGRWAAGLLAAAAVLFLTWFLRRPRPSPLLARHRRFQRLLARRGLERLPHEGPLDHGRRAAASWPAAAGPIGLFAGEYARLRYGGDQADAGNLRRLDGLLEELSEIA